MPCEESLQTHNLPRNSYLAPGSSRAKPSPHRMGGRTPLNRACDRCHKVKEKCRRDNSQDTCERCHRLGSRCRSVRPIVKAGRKPRYQRTKAAAGHTPRSPCNESSSSSPPSECSLTGITTLSNGASKTVEYPTALSVFVDLSEREWRLLNGMTQGQIRIDQFLVGPSFRIAHQETLLRHFSTATTLLRDAMIATSALIAFEYELQPSHQYQLIGHKRAASAVSALRSLKRFSPGDLSTVLMLAISAVTFALHISGNAFAICRHSLDLVKPIYESSTEIDPDSLAFLICLIHSETAECLLRCEIPTVRFIVQKPRCLVDRFMGVTSPLLSHFYDICAVSYALRCNESADYLESLRALDSSEMAVEQWTPILPPDFLTRFEQTEVVSILGQANIYRLSLLLICHRLRHPYGTETLKGMTLSDAILKELDQLIESTKRSIPCANIAFIVACFELIDPKRRQLALDQTSLIIEFSKQLQVKTKTLLKAFWAIRDTQDHFRWFDITRLLPK